MALYLGDKKVCPTLTIEKTIPSMKAFFEAGGKCSYSTAQSFEGCWQPSDSKNVTDMSSMFYKCSKLTTIPQLDTSKITDMNHMFNYCSKLTTIPKLDTSNVTDMTYMFSDCRSLTTIPQLDTSKVTKMGYTFYYCSKLTTIPKFDTSNVTDMEYMFTSCSSLTVIPQFDASKVTSMSSMLYYCSSLTAIHMININVNLSISSSTKFTREALVEIIGNLKAQTGGSKKLTMGSENLAKLTDEDKAVATGKGWTLA